MNETTQLLDLCQSLANASSKTELEKLKASHPESMIKTAWGMLDDSIKSRIQTMCQTNENQNKPSKTVPRLWELSQEIEQLEDAIAAIQDDPDLSDEAREAKLEETFNQWLQAGDNFDKKAEQVAAYIRHQESLAEARKTEYKRLRSLAEQAENQAERLRKYLTNQMVNANKKSVKGVTANISLRQKPPRVLLNIEPSELPPEYVKVQYTPKLTEIKKLLKAESPPDWAYLSDSHEYSVTIR